MAVLPMEIRGLTKSFQKQQVLQDVNITVNSGDIYGFLGPNGAGKSTTIRIIADLIRADNGSITIFGNDTYKKNCQAMRNTAMLIEKPAFYEHLSAETNLRLICRLLDIPAEAEIRRVLQWVDLGKEGGKKVKKYSQGMKQRLGIAQTLLGQPHFIILDEPTNGLDPLSMREIRNLIRRLTEEGMTIFLSSHLLYEVERICNRMGIIHNGRIVAEGEVGELLRETPYFWIEIETDNVLKAEAVLKEWRQFDEIIREERWIKLKLASSDIPEMINRLVHENISLYAVKPRTNLEDYFIHMVEA